MMDIWTIAAGVYLGGALLLISFFGAKRLARMSEQEEAERPGYTFLNGAAVVIPLVAVALSIARLG